MEKRFSNGNCKMIMGFFRHFMASNDIRILHAENRDIFLIFLTLLLIFCLIFLKLLLIFFLIFRS
jgi:hypothetical protein